MTEIALPPRPADLPSDWVEQAEIRLAQQSDLPALEWEGQYRQFRRMYQETYARMLRGTSLMWLAYLEGYLLGQLFVQLNCDRKELADGNQRAYLYSFRIRAAFQRHGLGARMLLHTEQDLRDRGYHIATLNVAKMNLRARAFYERHGYEVIAHEPGIWSYQDEQGIWHTVEEPAWRMWKQLDES